MSDYYDEDLEAIKRKKLEELQRRLQMEEEMRRRRQEEAARREALLRNILTPEARERLANVKLVRPELARAVEDNIIALVQAGQLQPPVGEDVVKRLLEAIYERTRREPRIKIKRK
ncbi:DNA-binding protein [Pyrodictium occultum]|uniref:DNA-binding protein CF15_02305 n=1 Tax=Pyrodictium occultum TaxID=2309 RepID=A0A0V8RUC0_PYROC|nr:DNA-binding protein [Pyrodictium occultum]KSW11673.1 DNA-binding protein [Pyrodictium occultum]